MCVFIKVLINNGVCVTNTSKQRDKLLKNVSRSNAPTNQMACMSVNPCLTLHKQEPFVFLSQCQKINNY
jgi:hypothetical protein